MNKIILTIALLITTGTANANKALDNSSHFVDLKLGSTSVAENSAIDVNEHNYSLAVERTHILATLSDNHSIYFGVKSGLELHKNSFYRFSNSSVILNLTTYYNILRTESEEGIFPMEVKGSGFGYIASLGGKYSISDNFDIGIQYQVNTAKLKYDELIKDINYQERKRISDDYTFSSLYISFGYKF
ncbi:hypothetical protein ACPSKX_25300 [Moritella viscosa]